MVRSLLVVIALAIVPVAVQAQTDRPNGTLLSSEPCPERQTRTLEQALARSVEISADESRNAASEGIVIAPTSLERLRQSLPSPERFAERIAYRGFECRSITYASDGLRIAGFLWKPIDTSGPPRPLLIFLRGGNNLFGPTGPWFLGGMYDFLKAGYVVLATQYRGGPGSDGKDGFGSPGDLNDVRNLVPLARSLGYVDTSRTFLFGGSRGGMQAFMVARGGLPLRAMAIRAGATDMRGSWATRPKLLGVQTPLFTDTDGDLEAAIDRRSPVKWVNEIRVPTILFHGTADWRVPAGQSLAVAAGLQKAGTPYELHIYEGDDHGITLNSEDMVARTIDFFHRFGGPPRRRD